MTTQSLAEQWRQTFLELLRQPNISEPLKHAACEGTLANWTTHLTAAVVAACEQHGWQAAAKGHPIEEFEYKTSELLSLDVTAFDGIFNQTWLLPTAIMELENQAHRVPYSLWKVLCIQAQLRMVFGYSNTTDERSNMLKTLKSTVISDFGSERLVRMDGETLVVVGSRDQAEQFPYSYFKWWRLEKRTGSFSIF